MPSSVEFSARTVVFCGSFFVVAYAVAAAYSLLVLAVPAGSALSRLALTTDVVLSPLCFVNLLTILFDSLVSSIHSKQQDNECPFRHWTFQSIN
jgi:hypothetical protein